MVGVHTQHARDPTLVLRLLDDVKQTNNRVVWLPALAWAIARDGFESEPWLVMLGIFLGLQIIIVPLVSMVIAVEKQNPTIINISLLLGFYAFGSYGVLLGPMVAGASLVILDLYKTYASAPPPGMT
jgi:predicted PurR-regulated permease PerM